MTIVYTVLLVVAAFGLGAVPFSVLVGRWLLGKDIQSYGDGNPGAINVFRAGGQKAGYLAVFLDVLKGTPFVFLAYAWLGLSDLSLIVVALSAVMGHAFSPFLGWHGGKAVAVTFGVLLALPRHEVLLAFIACVVVGFLFVENDAWVVVLGAAGTLAYLAVTGSASWTVLLMLCILALLVFKHFQELRSLPHLHGRLIRWLQSILRGTTSV
jgi:glycerol-3-phosphate acyltransferase PlsY